MAHVPLAVQIMSDEYSERGTGVKEMTPLTTITSGRRGEFYALAVLCFR